MSNCMLCKKEMPGIGGSVHDYAIVREFWGDGTLVGEVCDRCGEKIEAGKITKVIEAAITFFDQLDSFNDLYHPEVITTSATSLHKRAMELQKAVGEYHAPKRH